MGELFNGFDISSLSIESWWEGVKSDFVLNFIEDDRYKYITGGLKNTLIITLFACLLGIVIGIVIASVRSSFDTNREALKRRGGAGYVILRAADAVCKLYLTVIRGTPVVVQLLIMYFVIFAASDNGLLIASLAFGINSGAYVAEIIRGGIMSIDVGQFEAGRSLGFNYFQTMIYVIIPQVIKNVLPALLNEFITLLKETSVAGYVGIMDVTRAGNIIRGRTFSPFLPLIGVALIYLVIVVLLTKLVSILERRLRKSDR